MRRIIIPLFLLVAAFMAVSFAGAADAVHSGGEGHGEGIDAVYTSGEECVLIVSLASLPSGDVTVSVFTPSTGDYQYVGPIQASRSISIYVTELIHGTHEVAVTITDTGALVAECELVVTDTVRLTYSPSGGSGQMTPAEVEPGAEVTLSENGFTAPEGKAFKCWIVNGREYQPGQSIVINDDTVAEASWADAVCKITFENGGGSGSMPSLTVSYGETYILPDCSFTAPEGKSFGGWEIDGKVYKSGESIIIKGDTSVKATWSSGMDIMLIVAIAICLILILIITLVILKRRH